MGNWGAALFWIIHLKWRQLRRQCRQEDDGVRLKLERFSLTDRFGAWPPLVAAVR